MNPLNWKPRQFLTVRALLTFAVAALMVGAFIAPAQAADITVTWTNASSYTDGTAMPASDLQSTTAWCGLTPTTLTLSATVAAPATSVVVKNAQAGQTYVCGAAHTAKNGSTSDMSMLAGGVGVPALKPNPPTNLGAKIVTTGTTAYNVVQGQGVFALLDAGTVPLGTPCDQTQQVNGFFAVPKSAVTLKNPKSTVTVVVASCG